jgi:AcrR family transcriptional regulator
MPKRDAAYMAGQRDLIARATLDVLMDKGVHDTSMRDICSRAGVSIGAFYNLFPTKAEAIVAARYIDLTENQFIAPAGDWRGYVASLAKAFCSRDDHAIRRRRISLQFAAEILLMDHNPEGQPAVIGIQSEQMAANLRMLFDKGKIALPFGLERTVELHAQLGLGASYRLSNDLDLSVEQAIAVLEDGLAATAGLIR